MLCDHGKRFSVFVMGAALAIGNAPMSFGRDESKIKTKIESKDGRYKEKTKVDSKDGADQYKEDTKINNKNGNVNEKSKITAKKGSDEYNRKVKVKSKGNKTKTTIETHEKNP